MPRCDVAVVGGGIAGLYTAVVAAADAHVLLISKGRLRSSTSALAAAIGPDDAPALHAADAVRAARGLSRPSAVRALTEEAPGRIGDLIALGVEFDAAFGLDGGHSLDAAPPYPLQGSRIWRGASLGRQMPAALPAVNLAMRREARRQAGLVREAAGLRRLRRPPHILVRLVAKSALARAEGRGAHFRADFPKEDRALDGHLVLRPRREPVLEQWP